MKKQKEKKRKKNRDIGRGERKMFIDGVIKEEEERNENDKRKKIPIERTISEEIF